jgi:hypothetical protein
MLVFTREQLSTKTIAQLKDIAKSYNLSKFSTLKKSDLISFIASHEPSSFNTPIKYIYNESLQMYSIIHIDTNLPITALVSIIREHANNKKFSIQSHNEKELKALYRAGFRARGYEKLTENETLELRKNSNSSSIHMVANTTFHNIIKSESITEMEEQPTTKGQNNIVIVFRSEAENILSSHGVNLSNVSDWVDEDIINLAYEFLKPNANIQSLIDSTLPPSDNRMDSIFSMCADSPSKLNVNSLERFFDECLIVGVSLQDAKNYIESLPNLNQYTFSRLNDVYEMFVEENNTIQSNVSEPEQTQNNLYWYAYTLRGFSLGCQPSNHVTHNDNVGKHGIVAYNRPLTNKELSSYELIPYSIPITQTAYKAFRRTFPTYNQAYNYCMSSDFEPIYIEEITA